MGPTQDEEAAVWGTTALNFHQAAILWLLNICTGNTNLWITEDCKLHVGFWKMISGRLLTSSRQG